jgi:hypothetical protein
MRGGANGDSKGSFGNRKPRGEPSVFPGPEAHPETWARAKLPRCLEVHAAGCENPIHAFSSRRRSPTSRLLASLPRPFHVSPPPPSPLRLRAAPSLSSGPHAHLHHSASMLATSVPAVPPSPSRRSGGSNKQNLRPSAAAPMHRRPGHSLLFGVLVLIPDQAWMY